MRYRWGQNPSPAATRQQAAKSRCPLPQERDKLPLNPRKIRNLANRVTEPCQQSYPKRPFFRVWIIHHHAIEKRINGCAQTGECRHCAFEIFGLYGGGGERFGVLRALSKTNSVAPAKAGAAVGLFCSVWARPPAVPACAGTTGAFRDDFNIFAARLYPANKSAPSWVATKACKAFTRASKRTRSSSPPSANTASIRSCRTPASRCWTLRRSAKKSMSCQTNLLQNR